MLPGAQALLEGFHVGQEAGASSGTEKRQPKFLGARERVPTLGKEARQQRQAAHLCQAQHSLPPHLCAAGVTGRL